MGIGIAAFCILFGIVLCVVFTKFSKIKRECNKKISDAKEEAARKIAKAKKDGARKVAEAKERATKLRIAANKWADHIKYGKIYVEVLRKSGICVTDEKR